MIQAPAPLSGVRPLTSARPPFHNLITLVSLAVAMLGGAAVAAELVPNALLWATPVAVLFVAFEKLRRSQRGSFELAWLAGALGLIACLNLYAPAGPGWMVRVLASVVVVAGLLPAYLWERAQISDLPFLPVLGAMYALYFGTPVFLRQRLTLASYSSGPPIPEASIVTALLLTLLGLCCVFAGYCLVRLHVKGRARPTTPPRIPVVILLSAFGTAAYAFEIRNPLAAELRELLELASSCMILAACLLYARYAHRGRQSSVAALLVVSLVVVRLLLGLSTGAPAQFYGMLIPLLMLSAVRHKRMPMMAAAIGLILFAMLQAAKPDFRTEFWYQRRAETESPWAAGVSYLRDALDAARSTDFKQVIDQFSSRIGYLTTFAVVTEATPTVIPYWGGETFIPLLTKPVPRAFWPSKPEEVTGQSFGHRYALLQRTDTTTSYNLTQLVELYANWGVIGVCVGMLLLGAAFGLLHSVVVSDPKTGWSRLALASYVLGGLTLLEGSISSGLSQAFYRGLVSAIIVALTSGRHRGTNG